MRKLAVLLIIILIVGIGGLWYYHFYVANGASKNKAIEKAAVSFVTLEINPSVELTLDEDNNVIDVNPINEDADIITSDLDLVGESVEDASEDIIDAAAEAGYIDETDENNAVVVTVATDDEQDRMNLEKRVIDKLNNRFEITKAAVLVAARGLDDTLKAEATQYNISNGKMLLIDYAVALDPTLVKADLATKSVQYIQKTIKAYVTARHDAMKLERQEAIALFRQQKQAAIQEFRNKQEALKLQLWEANKDKYADATQAEKVTIMQDLYNQRKIQLRTDLNTLKLELQQDKLDIKQGLEEYSDSKYNYPILQKRIDILKQRIRDKINNRNRANNNQ